MSKKAQHIAEFAIIASVVVLAFGAISLYMQRGLQGRYKQFADSAYSNFSGVTGSQYEPYYLSQKFQVERSRSEQFDYKEGENFTRHNYEETKSSGNRQELPYIAGN